MPHEAWTTKIRQASHDRSLEQRTGPMIANYPHAPLRTFSDLTRRVYTSFDSQAQQCGLRMRLRTGRCA